MKIGNRTFDTDRKTYVMGILNVTPDSFSDGGRHNTPDAALYRCEQMLREGADLIDIGGESTRPGHEPVSAKEEISRVIPVVEAVKSRFDTVISLDTMKAATAREGILAGADMINDVWGLQGDPGMAEVIAKEGAACCLMVNRHPEECPKEEPPDAFYKAIDNKIQESLRLAGQAGIPKERIILDPGVGFGRTRRQDLLTIGSLERMKAWDCPVLLGVSRKRVIGEVLGVPVDERDVGTAAVSVYAVMKGCAFVRVHNVGMNVQAVRMAEALLSFTGKPI